MKQVIPETLETERLILRRPRIGDGRDIFEVYANDKAVAKYMSWPRHESLETTEQVVESWVEQWRGSEGGAFLITDRLSGSIIGSTGFDLMNSLVASSGFVLAKKQWGKGYATEALGAVVKLSKTLNIQRLFAYCHHEHRNSANVLEKCEFKFEGRLRNYMEFPNLSPGEVTDVLMYAWTPSAT